MIPVKGYDETITEVNAHLILTWLSYLLLGRVVFQEKTSPEDQNAHTDKLLAKLNHLLPNECVFISSSSSREMLQCQRLAEKYNISDSIPLQEKLNLVWEYQKQEVSDLLKNKEAILKLTNSNSAIELAFKKLEKLEDSRKLVSLITRDKLLDIINEAILYPLIQKSKNERSAAPLLDCRNCYLTRIPEKSVEDASSADYWKSLKYLYLKGNNLAYLPKNIGKLLGITFLDISNNKLRTLPTEIGQLSLLREFVLSNNNLTELPVTIGNLSSLKHLHISKNQLVALPESIAQLELIRLFADYNRITAIPESIRKIPSLMVINIEHQYPSELNPQFSLSKQNLSNEGKKDTTLTHQIKPRLRIGKSSAWQE